MKELKLFTAAALAWSALLVGINFAVDPIQNYRRDPDPVFLKNMRYQVPGIIRQYEFDTIMVGTSHSANFRPPDLDAFLDSESVNLSANSSSGWEQGRIVDLALQTRPVTSVVWEMNYRTLYLDAAQRVASGVFPLHLYERSPDSHFLYLYSLDTLWQSAKRVMGRGHRDIGTINSWAEKFADRFDGQHVRDHYCVRMGSPHSNWVPDYAAVLEESILPVIRAHPTVQFKMFLPPLSYYNYLIPGELRRFRAFRQALYPALSELDNAELFDFTSRFDWTGERVNYKDVEHYSPEISRDMLRLMAQPGDRANPADLAAMERELGLFLNGKGREEPPCI